MAPENIMYSHFFSQPFPSRAGEDGWLRHATFQITWAGSNPDESKLKV